MQAKDIMSNDIISVNEGTTLVDVAKLMKENDIGSIPVKNYNKLVGIVTDRDIVTRSIALNRDALNTTCGDVMSTDIVACSPEMEVDEIANLMARHQIRRIPVCENQEVIGIISLGDLSLTNDVQREAGDALSDISEDNNIHLQ